MSYRLKEEDCPHLNIAKEYFLGAQTGDFICLDCGLTSSSKTTFELLRKKKEQVLEKS